MKIKKLINIIKDGFRIYKESKKEKINIKVGMFYYGFQKQKFYITHILKDEPKTQIIYKGYYKNIKQTIYYINDVYYFNDYKLYRK